MKPRFNRLLATFLAAIVASIHTASAVDVVKGDNTNVLNLGTSWALGTAPTGAEIAVWSGTYNTAGSLSASFTASTPVSWLGIKIGSLSGTAAGLVLIGGTGSIAGAVNVTGVLSPGASIESLESGVLAMASGSTFVYEAVDNSATGADLMVVSGALSLMSATLDLSGAALAAGSWLAGDKLTLISDSGSPITSGFTGFADDEAYVFGSNAWRFDYNDLLSGNNYAGEALAGSRFVTMTVVPEPAGALLGGIGMIVLLRRRR